MPKRPHPDALSDFFAQFKDSKTSPSTRLTTPTVEVPLSMTQADVRSSLLRINPHKAAGPDKIPGRVLRDCASEVSEVLMEIFNISFSQAVVQTCMKTSTIIPIRKSSPVTGLNAYWPVALATIVTKCFERVIMDHIKDSIDGSSSVCLPAEPLL